MNVSILVVDDDPANRALITKALKRRGYETATADDARSGIEKIKTGRFQLVITDKNMPGINADEEGGMDVLKFIRQHHPEIQFMMITGYASVQTAIEAMKLGAFDYITKPFSISGLLDKIQRILEYKQFINPMVMIDSYKKIQAQALELINSQAAADRDNQHEQIRKFSHQLDLLFKQVKGQELIILKQRDALIDISGLTAQLLEIVDQESEACQLLEQISHKAGVRI